MDNKSPYMAVTYATRRIKFCLHVANTLPEIDDIRHLVYILTES